jgi:hypothetical protein
MRARAAAITGTPAAAPLLRWSLDASLMLRPTVTYQRLSRQPLESGWLVGLRRPIVIATALGCMASVLATGTGTLRLVVPATLYWSYAPLLQCGALGVVLLTLRERQQRTGATFDVYFAGRAAMVLLQLIIVGTLASVRPDLGWTFLTTAGIAATLAVLAWSARIDYCFFRDFLRQTPLASVFKLLILRLIVWPLVFGVIGVPGLTFGGLIREIFSTARELMAV